MNTDVTMEPEQFRRISRALADPRRMELLERIAAQDEVGCAAFGPAKLQYHNHRFLITLANSQTPD